MLNSFWNHWLSLKSDVWFHWWIYWLQQLDNKSLIRCFGVWYRLTFLIVVCILTRFTGSSTWNTGSPTLKNIQGYYARKHLIRYIYSPTFNTARVSKKIWRIINTITSIWRENMLRYLSLHIICSSKLTVFLELRSR